MIRILKELQIRMGEGWEQTTVTLWLVAYGKACRDAASQDRASFVKALAVFCRSQGWLLESGPDGEEDES